MTTSEHERMEELLASYSLDALTEDERRPVAAHLDACDACARRLAELRETASALASLPEQYTPPADLRSRIMAAIAGDADAGVSPVHGAVGISPVPGSGSPRWWRTPSFAAIAASLVALVATSAVLGIGWVRAEERADQNERLVARSYNALEIMARAERRWDVAGTAEAPDARGMLALSTEDQQASLVLWRLPDIENAFYNAWTVEGGRRVPVGRMWREADGWWAVLPVREGALEGVGVTMVRQSGGARADVIDFSILGDPEGGAAP